MSYSSGKLDDGCDDPQRQSVEADGTQAPRHPQKQLELGFCLGPDENGPDAAKRLNDLIAKTLKLEE